MYRHLGNYSYYELFRDRLAKIATYILLRGIFYKPQMRQMPASAEGPGGQPGAVLVRRHEGIILLQAAGNTTLTLGLVHPGAPQDACWGDMLPH